MVEPAAQVQEEGINFLALTWAGPGFFLLIIKV